MARFARPLRIKSKERTDITEPNLRLTAMRKQFVKKNLKRV